MTSRFRHVRPVAGRSSTRAAVSVFALLGALVAGALGAVPVTAAPVAAPADAPPSATGVPQSVALTDRVVVTWSAKLDGAAAAAPARVAALRQAAARGVRFERLLEPGQAVYSLDRRLGTDAPGILRRLGSAPGVTLVEPDLWVTADAIPNDTYAAQLWGLLGSTDGSPFGIDALRAWNTTSGSGVVVAVVDTGITSHPDLAGQSVAGYDMIEHPIVANDGNGRDSDPSDPGDWSDGVYCPGESSSWHGTHVAGTVAAIANNSAGVFGGAPAARIQAVRVLGRCGGFESDVADGIRWAAGGSVSGVPANATPARVINVSLGGASPSCSSYSSSAINSARANGAIVVVAAGNSSTDAGGFSPANCTAAMTVAAITSTGARASFSNYGSVVDVAAPGAGIISTVNAGTTSPSGATYANWDGTSMAAPHASTAAALLLAAQPSLSVSTAETILRQTATPFPSTPPLAIGVGAIDAGAAVDTPAVTAFTRTTPSPVTQPSISYSLHFSEAVTGLAADDFVVGGTSAPWTVNSVSGSGASYSVTLTSPLPTLGTVALALKAASIADASASAGPAVNVAAAGAVFEPFTDIASSAFRNDIIWIYLEQITSGCGTRLYCPNANVTRGEMASFLARALSLPPTVNDYFSDDESSPHEQNINRLREAGVTTGCTTGKFCPTGLVTRGEMASFLARALGLGGDAPDKFTDDETSVHETNINRLAAAGVTTGCTATTFCPSGLVTRGQMAAFLRRAFG